MKSDPDADPAVLEVIDTAALLDTSEFNVFCLAYTHWFGKKAGIELIEPHFNAYMFNEIVPFWVRHFTRHIAGLCASGHLNAHDYALQNQPVSTGRALLGRFYAFLLVLILLVLVVVTSGSEHLLLVAKNCYFPPCY